MPTAKTTKKIAQYFLVVNLQDAEILGEGKTPQEAIDNAVDNYNMGDVSMEQLDTGQLYLMASIARLKTDTSIVLRKEG